MKRRLVSWSLLAVLALICAAWLAWAYLPTGSSSRVDLEDFEHTVRLSPDEREKLAGLPVLRMGYVPAWQPLSFYDPLAGRVSGVAGEYADLLAQTLGLRFQLVPVGSMMELQNLMLKGEVDIVPLMTHSHPVGRRFIYSEPYETLPEVFVTRPGQSGRHLANELSGKVIVTAAPESTRQKLRDRIAGASVFAAPSATEGLDMVKYGHVEAYVGNAAIVDALIRGPYRYSLQIAGQTGLVVPLSAAIVNRYAWLVPLVNRVLGATPPSLKRQILNSWTAVVYKPSAVDWMRVAKKLLPALLAGALVLGALFLAFVKYRREALQRREAEAKLHAVTRNLPAVVFQARKSGVDDLAFDYVSGNSVDIWGLTPEAMRDHPWRFLERIDPRDVDEFLERQRVASESLEPFLLEFRVLNGSAQPRWIRGNAVPTHAPDGVVVWCGYWVDISDIKHQAAQIEAAKEAAERAAQGKAHFLAVMSHEIRTPMNGVVGMLELLRESRLLPEQAAMVDTIDESANHLLALLDEILDASKIEAGRIQLDARPFDVRSVVVDVVRLFKASAMAKGLALTLRVDPAVPMYVQGDALRLRQIFTNLVGNAIKFTNAGSVAVEIRREGDRQAAFASLHCTVTDTGVGLAGVTQEELFAPYTQGQTGLDLAGAVSGTGLGLSICRKIAQAMGGQLTLADNPQGKGAQAALELSLPVAAQAFIDRVPYQALYLAIQNPAVDRLLREYLKILGCEHLVKPQARDQAAGAPSGLELTCAPGEQVVVATVSGQRPIFRLKVNDSLLHWRDVVRLLQGEGRSEEGAPAGRSDEGGTRPCKVLVAEDHAISRKLLAAQLETLGCVVDSCEDGEDAWRRLARPHDYDVLITDGHMPRLDGVSLLQRLRQSDDPALRTLPVALLSATPLVLPGQPTGLAQGVTILLKPVKLGELDELLRGVVSSGPDDLAAPVKPSMAPPAGVMDVPAAVLREFAMVIEEDRTRLPALLQARDLEALQDWVHRQAGALAVVGHVGLADRAVEVENILKNRDASAALPEVAAFDGELAALARRFAQA